MKKIFWKLSIFALCVLPFSACDSSDSGQNIEYADLTIEQNKAQMVSDGQALIEQMQGMQDVEAIDVTTRLMSYLQYLGSSNNQDLNAVVNMLTPITSLKNNYRALTSVRAMEQVQAISDAFDQVAGTYSFDIQTYTWNYIPGASQIVFNFPIGESLTNNGSLTINNLQVKENTNVDIDTQELPESLDVVLKRGTTEIMGIRFDASYNSYCIPTSESFVYSFLEGYSINQSMTNNDENAAFNVKCKKDAAILMEVAFAVKGNLGYANLHAQSDIDGDEAIQNILDNANASVRIGNIEMRGLLSNVDEFVSIQNEMDSETYQNTQASSDAICQRLNNVASMVLLYADQNKAIAKSLFYTEELSEITYNGSNTYYIPTLKFVFKDGSSMDETFFMEGFESLQQSVEEFISSFVIFMEPQ